MAGFEKLVAGLVGRIDLLEKQMENMINHCNKATNTVQKLVWDLAKLKGDKADGTTESICADDCSVDCLRGG